MKTFNPVRGTNDYAPRAAKIRAWAKQTILESYQENGYNLITTPILEHLDFLNSSDGGDNLRLMFKTIKRKDKLDLTKPNLTEEDITAEGLRYDLTVPLARFYANNKEKLPTPFKSIQIDYAFRAERPQRGRDRQFIQCDIDVFGDATINAELELLKTIIDTYQKLGFNKLVVKINSRKILTALILNAGFNEEDVNSVCITLDKLDKISLNGVIMELIEKNFATENINKLADTLADININGVDVLVKNGANATDVAEITYLINTLNKITNNRYEIKFDVSIVRGQGYYTGAVFEVYTDGFGGAIGGGGRYDNMVGKFSGQPVPAVGFGLGFEPVCMLIKERGIEVPLKQNLALIYDDEDICEVFKVKEELKKHYNVSLYKRAKNMKSFYEKIVEVADCVTSVADYKQGKEIKLLNM